VDGEHRVPVTPETPFWVASITKQFTASAILKLVEEGKLALGDSIGAYFRGVPPPRRATTVHQLLTHTAGLGQNYVADGIADRDAAVDSVLAQPLSGRLGQDFTYSNDAYSVLAALVEVVSGATYEDYVRTGLLDPAGLAHTGFWGPADHPEVAPIDRALPDSILRPNWGYRGGVGMYSSAADLYRGSARSKRTRTDGPRAARGCIALR
jgi:CubicO group peptidase (beta-lactamase class C family)